jgi:chaperonin cofactor prefoldin
MKDEEFVKVSGPAQVYGSMDKFSKELRRAESLVEELEEIRAKKESIKALMLEEVDRAISDLNFLDGLVSMEERKTEPQKKPLPPKIVRKVPETKPVLTSVRIKPKKDAQVEKEKKVLKSSIHDLKGELERLKKELGKK